jgi:hypothetical protein
MRDVWGCEGPAEMQAATFADEENGMTIIYHSCPLRFIPDSVISFISHYDYIKNFSSVMPKYNDLSPRFKQALHFFENQLSTYTSEVNNA